jgi:hypothetical protein
VAESSSIARVRRAVHGMIARCAGSPRDQAHCAHPPRATVT